MNTWTGRTEQVLLISEQWPLPYKIEHGMFQFPCEFPGHNSEHWEKLSCHQSVLLAHIFSHLSAAQLSTPSEFQKCNLIWAFSENQENLLQPWGLWPTCDKILQILPEENVPPSLSWRSSLKIPSIRQTVAAECTNNIAMVIEMKKDLSPPIILVIIFCIIIPQVRMLESDWLFSHVVLIIPHGRQTNITWKANSGKVMQVCHVSF